MKAIQLAIQALAAGEALALRTMQSHIVSPFLLLRGRLSRALSAGGGSLYQEIIQACGDCHLRGSQPHLTE